MSLTLQIESAFLLILAALLSMIVGMDRERRHRPAGLRTHMLVGVGACLFTLLSIHAFPGSDSARVAAQIVTGIGFLGAGTIIQRKSYAHDLTTAASIWATAAIGIAVGVGAWFLALTATLIVWIVLAIIRRFSKDEATTQHHEESL
jgi:putative Mg2+ transporter-C (MgtC) family protein